MLICWEIPVITKQCFQNELLFQTHFKDIPGILQGYENTFMKLKSSKNRIVGYLASILILEVSSIAKFF